MKDEGILGGMNFILHPSSFRLPFSAFVRGTGALEEEGKGALRFVVTDANDAQYSDAQLDDYQPLSRRNFLWRPPLRMSLRARFSHPAGALRGTAGFGFWNDPFMMTGPRKPALPRALWFFYASPPSNMALALDVPGFGWKAATIDALRWPFLALLPLSPVAAPLMNFRRLYRAAWPLAQRAINVSEAIVPAKMTDWHTYTIEWEARRVRFFVDQDLLLDCDTSPRGPLGFVMWLDNQFMIVTPQGRLKHGLLNAPGRQWMAIEHLQIQKIAPERNLS